MIRFITLCLAIMLIPAILHPQTPPNKWEEDSSTVASQVTRMQGLLNLSDIQKSDIVAIHLMNYDTFKDSVTVLKWDQCQASRRWRYTLEKIRGEVRTLLNEGQIKGFNKIIESVDNARPTQ